MATPRILDNLIIAKAYAVDEPFHECSNCGRAYNDAYQALGDVIYEANFGPQPSVEKPCPLCSVRQQFPHVTTLTVEPTPNSTGWTYAVAAFHSDFVLTAGSTVDTQAEGWRRAVIACRLFEHACDMLEDAVAYCPCGEQREEHSEDISSAFGINPPRCLECTMKHAYPDVDISVYTYPQAYDRHAVVCTVGSGNFSLRCEVSSPEEDLPASIKSLCDRTIEKAKTLPL